MSRTSPITAAATAGPTPKTSVTVVPEARTADGQLLLGVAPLGVDAAQVGQELPGQLAAGLPGPPPDGWICSRTRAAACRVDLLADPAGISSHSTACIRHTTWLRDRLRSRCRLAHTFSTAA